MSKPLTKVQKRYLDRMLNKDVKSHQKWNKQIKRETYENQLKWTKENISPNGGKKSFKINTDA